MSRTTRIARALTIGYGFQAVVAVTGLVLTPFLLSRLGVVDLGRWLVAGQVLGLLGLLDLGVAAVLPREVARASGSAREGAVAEVVRRAWWLVWLQTPLVALIAVGVWFGVSVGNEELSGPFAVVLIAFVIQFPLRVPGAVLSGLQELTFGAGVTAAAWACTTAVSVGLVFAGSGLYALAIGWAVGQGVTCAAAWWRLRTKFPAARPAGSWPGRTALTALLGPSLWTSLRQLAQLMLNGAELIVLGWVTGPAAVVAYACTVKIISMVNNQPYLIATSALPAIAELQARGDRDRLWRASRALGLAMLLFSGGLAVAVLAVNPAFVPRWVGPDQYGGPLLTLLSVLVMTLRHLVFAMIQITFALGYDRRLSVAGIADGVVTLVATAGWVAAVGVVGVPLGSLTGLVLTNAAVVVGTLAEAEGTSWLQALRWAAPWFVRFVAVAGPVTAVSFTPVATDPVVAAGLLLGGGALYAGLVLPLFAREPLRGYRERIVSAVRQKFGPKIT